MGAPLTYEFVEKLFKSRRKNTDVKKYKTDTHIFKQDDGTFLFKYVVNEWQQDADETGYKKVCTGYVDLLSITPDNVVTLLMNNEKAWPSMRHMTIRNRMAQLTGFSIYSDTSHHKNKGTAVRVRGIKYDRGWMSQDWCANGSSLPYVPGTQFKTISDGRHGGVVDCLNPPTDVKHLVKQESIQQVKAETAVIRKLAMAMLRLDFDAQIMSRVNYSYPPRVEYKRLEDVDYKNPTGDDAMAVLYAGLYMTNRPDQSRYDPELNKWIARSEEEMVQSVRARVLENGMKALRKHIYKTTDGYEEVEVS